MPAAAAPPSANTPPGTPPTTTTPPIAPTPVQLKRFALRVRLTSGSPDATAYELWYTRDDGATWQRGPRSERDDDSIVFEARGEGAYGFYVVASSADGTRSAEPKPGTPPQRRVFVDYTPPLVQFKGVDVLADTAGARRVAVEWAAYDANFADRPIALAYQPAGQTQWQPIDTALANTGRFDWSLPTALRGRVTFRLTARDHGGHVVERLFGPVSLDSPRVVESPSPTTKPAGPVSAGHTPPTTTQPTTSRAPMPPTVDLSDRARAAKLYELAEWHHQRGDYAEAQERYREALSLDPTLTLAWHNLGRVLYSRGRYAEAVDAYESALKLDANHVPTLRGLARAYEAKRQYTDARTTLERVLALDKNDAEACVDLGDVLYQMGDTLAARSHWSQAVAMPSAPSDVVLRARNHLALFAVAGDAAARADTNR